MYFVKQLKRAGLPKISCYISTPQSSYQFLNIQHRSGIIFLIKTQSGQIEAIGKRAIGLRIIFSSIYYMP